jgi:ubiquinone/menaquinone biosynthesis C-methylase UbiE
VIRDRGKRGRRGATEATDEAEDTAMDTDQDALSKIEKAYDSSPWYYDVRGFLILTFAYRSSLWTQVRLFGENMADPHLEVAIGSGTLLEIILRWRKWKGAPKVTLSGFDYAEPMLAGARHRFRKDEIELFRADVTALDLPDNRFRSANVANALHCFPDVDAALREIHRVMQPGGQVAMNVLLYPRGNALSRWIAQRINEWGMRKGILYTPYERERIVEKVRAAGFTVVRDEVQGNTCNLIARK